MLVIQLCPSYGVRRRQRTLTLVDTLAYTPVIQTLCLFPLISLSFNQVRFLKDFMIIKNNTKQIFKKPTTTKIINDKLGLIVLRNIAYYIF